MPYLSEQDEVNYTNHVFVIAMTFAGAFFLGLCYHYALDTSPPYPFIYTPIEILPDTYRLNQVNWLAYWYGYIIPVLILGIVLVDLDEPKFFIFWTLIGLIFIMIYFSFQAENWAYITYYNRLATPKSYEKIYAFKSFKLLPLFLIIYQCCNLITKKLTGSRLVNTFHVVRGYHQIGNQRIRVTQIDVIFNILLYILLLLAMFWW